MDPIIVMFGILLAYEGILCTIAVGLPTFLIMMPLNMDSEARHISLLVAWFALLMVFVYLCVFLLLLPPVYMVVKERIMIWHMQ